MQSSPISWSLAAVLVCSPAAALAQVPEALQTLERVFPRERTPRAIPRASAFTVTYDQQGALGGADTAVSLRTFELSTGLPLQLSERRMLLFSLGYNRTDLDVTAEGVDSVFHGLQQLKFGVALRERWAPRWVSYLRVAPSLASDMHDVGLEHLSVSAQALLQYEFSAHHTLGFGVAASHGVTGTRILPAVTYELFKGRTHVLVRAPERVEVMVTVLPGLEVGAVTRYANSAFRLGEGEVDTLRNSSLWSGAVVDWNVIGGLHVKGTLGHTWMRKLEARRGGERVHELSPEETMIGRVSLSWELDS